MYSGNLNILEWSFLYNNLTPAFGAIKGMKFKAEVGTMVIVKGCNALLKQNLSLYHVNATVCNTWYNHIIYRKVLACFIK